MLSLSVRAAVPISALLSFGPHATAAFPRGGAGLFLPAPPQQYRGAGRPRVYVPCLLIARERERELDCGDCGAGLARGVRSV